MAPAERISDQLKAGLSRLLSNIRRSIRDHMRQSQHQTARHTIVAVSGTGNQLRHHRVHPWLVLHQDTQPLSSLVPHDNTGRIASALDERALELREEGLDERGDALEHRRECAEDGCLDCRRVRCSLGGNTDQRSCEGDNEWLDGALLGTFDEVADSVGGLLALLVCAARQTSDDDGYSRGDALGEAEAGNVVSWGTGRLDAPSEGDSKGF